MHWNVTDFIPPDLIGAPMIRFGYAIDFESLAAGAADTQTFVVQSDSDFMWSQLVAVVSDPAAPQTPVDPQGLTINITDEGSGRNFFSRAAGLLTVCGLGVTGRAEGGYNPIPTWIDRASQVNTTITNNKAAQDVRVRLTFKGFKIFAKSQAGMR